MMREPIAQQLLDLDEDDERQFKLISATVTGDPGGAQALGERLIASPEVRLRAIGADILGQVTTVDPARRSVIVDVLLGALDEGDDAGVLESIAVALGHAFRGGLVHVEAARARDTLIRLGGHADPAVRFAVAFSLPLVGPEQEVAGMLRTLSRDVDPDVRDWATFALAESDLADEMTREALLARADDAHDDTRAEAIYGLSRRHDPVAHALIERELGALGVGELILRARDEQANAADT